MSAYSPEVYDTIAQFGLRAGAAVLDVGCGDGAACAPFAAKGFVVTGVDPSPTAIRSAKTNVPAADFVEARAEALPFPNERFDLAISAQAFARFDRAQALDEMFRVLRSGGIVAIWWKSLMSSDPVRRILDSAFASVGKAPVPDGMAGGFKEFYASAFTNQTLRVIPWRSTSTVSAFVAEQRERTELSAALGSAASRYFEEIDRRLAAEFGGAGASVPLAYVHYLYLASKA